jgi:anti-sigma regulatory factor (Ser/Thr protein kinase)
MLHKGKITLSTGYDIKKFDLMRDSIVSFLEGNNIATDIISEIELTIYEVIANIIEHSSIEKRGKEISCELLILQNRVEIKIENIGERFDITAVEFPGIYEHFKKGRKRGLGIYIIRTLMDRVEYTYRGNCNILKFVKEL